MSESTVGVVEQELLDRTRERLVAARCGYYRQLEDIAELDQRGVALATGDRVVDRLVQDLGSFDPAEARRLVDEAQDLVPRRSLRGELLPARYPCTAQVLSAGRITPGHVAVIRKAMNRLAAVETISPADLADCERILAEAAAGMPPRMLRQVADKLLAQFDPDGVAPPEGEGRFDELRLLRRRDGSLALKGRLRDPLDAEMIVEVFDLLSTPTGPDDDRDLPARHADALKDLAHHALGPTGVATDARLENTEPDAGDTQSRPEEQGERAVSDADHATAGTVGVDHGADESAGREQLALDPALEPAVVPALRPLPRPGAAREPVAASGRALLTITMDHRWLCAAAGHGTLDSGAPVDAAVVRRWACDAEIIPMVLGTRSEPLDVGRRARTAPDAIRRALHHRDGGCAFPGCTRRPRRCQAHHIDHWLDGGDTCLDNMCLLCRFHHQLVHHGHWTIAMIDGLPWFTPPHWIDPERRPRPGGRARTPT